MSNKPVTCIHYTYADASNYKQSADFYVQGVLLFEQLQPYLDADGDTFFCPADVGMPHPGEKFKEHADYPGEDDHCWCSIEEAANVYPVTTPTSLPGVTAVELLERFQLAYAQGWPAQTEQPLMPV